MADFPKESLDKHLTEEPPERGCDHCGCGPNDDCYEDCECEDCLIQRAESHEEGMRDTYD